MVALFDYTTMVWAFVLGYWMFGEVPTVYVYIGSAIVAASGLFVIWRERQLRPAPRGGVGRAGQRQLSARRPARMP
jgi:drug/metabolite transporter (DMT)-like permease